MLSGDCDTGVLLGHGPWQYKELGVCIGRFSFSEQRVVCQALPSVHPDHIPHLCCSNQTTTSDFNKKTTDRELNATYSPARSVNLGYTYSYNTIMQCTDKNPECSILSLESTSSKVDLPFIGNTQVSNLVISPSRRARSRTSCLERVSQVPFQARVHENKHLQMLGWC